MINTHTSLLWSPVGNSDGNWEYVKFLLGTNDIGNKNAQIIDSSLYNNTINVNGQASQGSVSPYNVSYGRGSISRQNNLSGYLTIPGSSNFLFTGDYTIECWFKQTASGNFTIYDNTGSGGNSQISLISGELFHGIGTVGNSWGSPNFTLNTWYHLAFSRVGTTLRCFINGNLFGTKNISGNIGSSTNTVTILIRNDLTATLNLNGAVSDLRVINGTGLYTENFNTSTSPLETITNTVLHLKCNTYNVYDKKNNMNGYLFNTANSVNTNYKFSYSLTTPASGDRIIFSPYNNLLDYGTGDFTWELWCYTTTYRSNMYLLDHNSNGGVLQLYNNVIRYYDGVTIFNTSSAIPYGQWCHIALCRINGYIKLFLNGTQIYANTASTKNFSGITKLTIGGYGGGNGYNWGGNIESVRILNYGIYTTNFTPRNGDFPTS